MYQDNINTFKICFKKYPCISGDMATVDVLESVKCDQKVKGELD